MTRLGRYEVESELGRGSMGVVYLAHDPQIRRRVAVKTISLPDGLSAHQREEFRKRFLREAQAAGSLTHPGIVTIYGVEETDERDLPFITMEYVAGRNLQHILKTEGRLVPERAFQMSMALAEALQTAHSAGIVHRDIKPANILVRDADGAVKITDFGVARVPLGDLTESNGILGSPSYMAPEQIRTGIADARSDLFALAVILWESLSGERLYSGEDIVSIGHRIVSEPAPSITTKVRGLPPSADAFFDKALAKDPAQRFQNAAAFREAINELLLEIELDRLSTTAMPESPFIVVGSQERTVPASTGPSLIERWSSPRRWLPLVIGLLLVAVTLMAFRGPARDESGAGTTQAPAQQSAPAEASPGAGPVVEATPADRPAGAASADPGTDVSAPLPVDGATKPPKKIAQSAEPAPAGASGAASPSKVETRSKPPAKPAAKTAAPEPQPKPAESPATAPADGVSGEQLDTSAEAGEGAEAGAEVESTQTEPVTSAEPASPLGATLVISLASRIKDGTLVLLVDGEELFSAELEASGKKFQRIFKKVTQQVQESLEESIDVAAGRHQITARLSVTGKSNVSEATVELDLDAGTTRMIEVVAGKKFGIGDPLTLKVSD